MSARCASPPCLSSQRVPGRRNAHRSPAYHHVVTTSGAALRTRDAGWQVMVGGRDFDALLAQKFCAELLERHGVDVVSAGAGQAGHDARAKTKLRLLAEAERAKQVRARWTSQPTSAVARGLMGRKGLDDREVSRGSCDHG
jgi:hypothetical protein